MDKLNEFKESLTWRENDAIVNHFGEYVYLKALIIKGKRIGITECCEVINPCVNHCNTTFYVKTSRQI